MEGLKLINDSIDYMEKNLAGQIDINELAQLACLSKFHYQRMFHMLTGVTVAEYIRKRRLTMAAQELAATNGKIIDIALKYGYDTPESFSKAFRKLHGFSPSKARVQGASLKAFPRISFQIQIKGEKDMNYKVEEKESFKLLGKGIRVSTKDGENNKRIPAFWEECNTNGFCEGLFPYCGMLGMIGVCMDFDPEQEEITYFIGIEKPEESLQRDDLQEVEIPSNTWAIFESIGPMPHAIQEVWNKIFAEWFPATGYEHADGPELEVYPSSADPASEDYYCEVWVPILKK